MFILFIIIGDNNIVLASFVSCCEKYVINARDHYKRRSILLAQFEKLASQHKFHFESH